MVANGETQNGQSRAKISQKKSLDKINNMQYIILQKIDFRGDNMEIRQFKEDYYISENGEVFKKLKPYTAQNGYMVFKDKDGIHNQVHRMVAMTFIPNPENKPNINHIGQY